MPSDMMELLKEATAKQLLRTAYIAGFCRGWLSGDRPSNEAYRAGEPAFDEWLRSPDGQIVKDLVQRMDVRS